MNLSARSLFRLNIVLLCVLFVLSFGATAAIERRQEPIRFSSDPSPEETSPLSGSNGSVIESFAAENGFSCEDYPESLVALLERNPETEFFVLHYPLLKDHPPETDLSQIPTDSVPLFLQWDTRWGYEKYGNDLAGLTACGPVCLSMVAYYLTENPIYTPQYMMDFAAENGYCIPGDGTSWTLFSEGAETLGFDVTEIPMDEERILENLSVENPIVCAMGPGDFTASGHYVVMVGLQDGMIRINDPNSAERSDELWDLSYLRSQIENLWVIRYFD